MKLNNPSKKNLTCRRRQPRLTKEEVKFFPNLKIIRKKTAETKILKPKKTAGCFKNILKKRLMMIPRHQKWLQGLAAE